MPGPHGTVSEDDVKALFNSDGELRDPNDRPEPDSEEVESEEEEAEEEETEEEESEEEEEESEEDDSEFNWDGIDARAKAQWEKAQAEATKWQKAHGKIQSDFTKAAQSRKDFDQKYSALESRDQLLSQFEELLEANPEIYKAIEKAAQKKNSGFAGLEIPDYLAQDPAVKLLQSYTERMEKELRELKGTTGRFQQQEAQAQEAKNREALDKDLAAAGEKIKSMLGRDATEEDLTKVLQFMVDNKAYGKGPQVALAVFAEDYEKALQKKSETAIRDKAKKFPTRAPAVNSKRVSNQPRQAMDSDAAVRMAMEEAGIKF